LQACCRLRASHLEVLWLPISRSRTSISSLSSLMSRSYSGL
jgi:hypothetical protein